MQKKLRKLRTIEEVLRFIKKEDKDTAVTRFMIERLITKKSIFYTTTGNRILIDLDEVLEKLGLIYENKKNEDN